jgi:hypothetical protein
MDGAGVPDVGVAAGGGTFGVPPPVSVAVVVELAEVGRREISGVMMVTLLDRRYLLN